MQKIFILLLLAYCSTSLGQYHLRQPNSNNNFQYGISAKVTAEIKRREPHFRVGLSSGIGCPIIGNSIYPTVNIEWQLYYGGFGSLSGSPKETKKNRYFSSDIILSGMATAGFRYSRQPTYVPLYYLTDMAQPSLLNPYKGSLSIGTNLILALDGDKEPWQQVGYINLHAWYFQLGYYNDGGGMQKAFLGDGEDRYYTGGGFIAVTLPENNVVNTVTASYHKFTGYTLDAFDITNSLNIANVYYKKVKQQYYNRSYWNFSVGSARYGLSAFYQFNNPLNRRDFQNLIHYIGYYGYHQIPYPRYQSFGVTYFQSRHQINAR